MQALVTSNEYDIGDEAVSINISFLRQLQDTETQTAKKKPNRPEQEQEPDPPDMDIPETPRPEMSAESVSTPEFGGPAFGSFSASTDADVLPIVKVPPQYPRRATQRGIEGWVLVEFTITPSGAVVNPVVVDAEPPGIFNRSALRTIVKWKYVSNILYLFGVLLQWSYMGGGRMWSNCCDEERRSRLPVCEESPFTPRSPRSIREPHLLRVR